MTDLDLTRLEALAEKATPAPWSFYNGDLWTGATADELELADRLTAELNYSDEAEDIFEKADHVFHGDPREPADAEFIAALRNAAPSLLAASRAVQRVEALAAEWASDREVDEWNPLADLRAALGGAE